MTVVVDPVAESIGKLDSFHAHIRRDAAVALGKYGDARGVAPLINKLEHDFDKEVRMAAAWALAEIGDPRAIIPLETAKQFDKRADVRAVATKSLDRMPTEAPPAQQQPHAQSRVKPQQAQPRDAEAAYGYPTPTPAGSRSPTPTSSAISSTPRRLDRPPNPSPRVHPPPTTSRRPTPRRSRGPRVRRDKVARRIAPGHPDACLHPSPSRGEGGAGGIGTNGAFPRIVQVPPRKRRSIA